MRRILLATILALALMTAPLAFAHSGDAKDDDDDREPRTTKSHGERNVTSDKANRTADREAFHAFVDSWHENATKIRDHCHALKAANNTTDAKHCIRDGYRAWWTAHWGPFVALKSLAKHADRGHRGHGVDG